MPSPQNCLEEFNLGLTATAIGVVRCPCELSQVTVLFGVSARCASAAIGAEPVVGKYSQEMLAEMIGTTRSRVSFFMNKFRKLGFIEYNGKLEVHKSLLNMVLHEKPEIKRRDEAISAE